MSASHASLITADLSDPRHFTEGPPFEILAALREQDPVHYNSAGFVGEAFWSITRWDDINACSKDSATFSSAGGSTIPGTAIFGDMQKLMMVSQDPPQHTERRALLQKVFTPRVIAAQTGAINSVINGLIDDVAAKGRCDLVTDLARPFPTMVIADMLGVPRENQTKLLAWSDAITSLQGADDSSGALATAVAEMGEYLASFIALRRAEPQDDLISRLIKTEVEGVSLNDAELLVSFAELMVAGNETARSTLAGAIWLLIEHPDQLSDLRANPDLLQNAVEEVLRYWTPNVYQARTATRDVVVGDCKLEEGQRIAMWLCSANRDPARHIEPDRFDIRRQDAAHMSFGGGGRHHCLGAALARLELTIGLRVLLTRLGDLALDADPVVAPHTFLHALTSLPLRFTA
ncbi:cytochrome P450 [Mycobacteroides abscessus]|uniref:cytochrome P450 n=1 Tax=Mycobacteroides abscessus TaxID=36809 RepID=UPI0006980944|nr:cytochrome P450 [Mycobacteroides abscessus]